MKSIVQQALGEDWEKLPPSLQAHHQYGSHLDIGHLDIEFPGWMTPCLWILHRCGALLARRGKQVPTRVEKESISGRQRWRRTLQWPDGVRLRFDSEWVATGGNRLIEFVNGVMGLEMTVFVEGGALRIEGVRFVLKFGRFLVGLPEWLLLGHTSIVERDSDGQGFDMDFRLDHPLFGRVFRYAGSFVTLPVTAASGSPFPPGKAPDSSPLSLENPCSAPSLLPAPSRPPLPPPAS